MNGEVSDLCRMGAREAVAAIRAGRVSVRELVDACLARAEAREGELHAWHCLWPEAARSAAEAAGSGLLGGVPVGVKDLVATSDLPTACGSPIYQGHRTPGDAACVAALRAQGGVVLGKTATTEFAAFTPTETRNPRNPGHTPGGSSSGSAAAVADFQVPVAIGTQTAGSIIRPASFCGVVGLKPTFGTIEYAGVRSFASSLDTLGAFARNVGDVALFIAAMAGWPELARIEPKPPARVRIVRGPRWEAVTPEAEAAVERAATVLAEAGVPVEEAKLPEEFDSLVDLQDRIQIYEGRRALAWERTARGELLSEGLRYHLDRAGTLSFADYRADRIAQVEWQRWADETLTDGEIWLTASAPGEAPEGLTSTGDPVFCRVWTLLHLPCISLPNGVGPRGLPLGTQLIAPRWKDADLVAASAWLEARLG